MKVVLLLIYSEYLYVCIYERPFSVVISPTNYSFHYLLRLIAATILLHNSIFMDEVYVIIEAMITCVCYQHLHPPPISVSKSLKILVSNGKLFICIHGNKSWLAWMLFINFSQFILDAAPWWNLVTFTFHSGLQVHSWADQSRSSLVPHTKFPKCSQSIPPHTILQVPIDFRLKLLYRQYGSLCHYFFIASIRAAATNPLYSTTPCTLCTKSIWTVRTVIPSLKPLWYH